MKERGRNGGEDQLIDEMDRAHATKLQLMKEVTE